MSQYQEYWLHVNDEVNQWTMVEPYTPYKPYRPQTKHIDHHENYHWKENLAWMLYEKLE